MRISSVFRYVWTAPTTALGFVVLGAGLWRAQLRVVDGVLEAHGPLLEWMLTHLTFMPGGAAAVTFGHLVIGRDGWWLESTRAHERVHVRQCEAWGPLFVPAYLAASVAAVLHGRNFYFDNRFEVAAFGAARNAPRDRTLSFDRTDFPRRVSWSRVPSDWNGSVDRSTDRSRRPGFTKAQALPATGREARRAGSRAGR